MAPPGAEPKNGSRNGIKADSLIPNPQPSAQPGQAQTTLPPPNSELYLSILLQGLTIAREFLAHTFSAALPIADWDARSGGVRSVS